MGTIKWGWDQPDTCKFPSVKSSPTIQWSIQTQPVGKHHLYIVETVLAKSQSVSSPLVVLVQISFVLCTHCSHGTINICGCVFCLMVLRFIHEELCTSASLPVFLQMLGCVWLPCSLYLPVHVHSYILFSPLVMVWILKWTDNLSVCFLLWGVYLGV